MRSISLLIFIILSLNNSAHSAIDTVYLEGYASRIEAIPIGLVPFEDAENVLSFASERPERILYRDLFLSGRFRPIVSPAFDKELFQKEGAAYFLHGRIVKKPQGYSIECRLSAVHNSELLDGKTYEANDKIYRPSVHDFSDRITEKLWGEPGSASSFLTYVQKIQGKKQIVVSDYDGYRKQVITKDNNINTMPVWAFGHKGIYYVSFAGGMASLYFLDLNTGLVHSQFSSVGQAFAPAVSPDGNSLLFVVTQSGASDIFVGNLKSGKVEKLTFHSAVETSPAWSPNGREIVFSSDKSGSPQIYSMDQYGGDIRRVTYMGRYNESAAWSPDGEKIAYVSMDNGLFNIYTCNLDGSEVVQLTSDVGNNEHPTWSPDSKMIAFSSTRAGSSDIYIMRADGSGVTKITDHGSASLPSWSRFIKSTSGEKK